MRTRWKLLILFLIFCALSWYFVTVARDSGFRVGYSPVQPVNFSHKIHAGDNQISCQYCHFAADKGRHAGIPPTESCLNCHSKIKSNSPEIMKVKAAITSKDNVKWVRVHNLPDFAYFNHSQHVRVGKISCQACHGEVQKMDILTQEKPMNMGWCIECHRQNEIAAPKDHKNASGGDCASCHY